MFKCYNLASFLLKCFIALWQTQKIMQHMQCNIPRMCNCWYNPVDLVLQVKSSMVIALTSLLTLATLTTVTNVVVAARWNRFVFVFETRLTQPPTTVPSCEPPLILFACYRAGTNCSINYDMINEFGPRLFLRLLWYLIVDTCPFRMVTS